MQSNYDLNILKCALSLYLLVFSDFSDFDEISSPVESLVFIFFLLATLILIIVMLNLLISIISDTYGKVSKIWELTYEQNKMKIILDIETNTQTRFKMEKFLVTLFRNNPNDDKNEIQLLTQVFFF